jgi:hypothetical protein
LPLRLCCFVGKWNRPWRSTASGKVERVLHSSTSTQWSTTETPEPSLNHDDRRDAPGESSSVVLEYTRRAHRLLDGPAAVDGKGQEHDRSSRHAPLRLVLGPACPVKLTVTGSSVSELGFDRRGDEHCSPHQSGPVCRHQDADWAGGRLTATDLPGLSGRRCIHLLAGRGPCHAALCMGESPAREMLAGWPTSRNGESTGCDEVMQANGSRSAQSIRCRGCSCRGFLEAVAKVIPSSGTRGMPAGGPTVVWPSQDGRKHEALNGGEGRAARPGHLVSRVDRGRKGVDFSGSAYCE